MGFFDKLFGKKEKESLDEGLQNKAQSPEGAKALLLEYPSLIKRPVVDHNGQLSIGQIDFTKDNS